jgi:hypothetical protein
MTEAADDTLTEGKLLEAMLKMYWDGPIYVRESVPRAGADGKPGYLMVDDVLGVHGGKCTLICHPDSAAELIGEMRRRVGPGHGR